MDECWRRIWRNSSLEASLLEIDLGLQCWLVANGGRRGLGLVCGPLGGGGSSVAVVVELIYNECKHGGLQSARH